MSHSNGLPIERSLASFRPTPAQLLEFRRLLEENLGRSLNVSNADLEMMLQRGMRVVSLIYFKSTEPPAPDS